MAEKHTHNGKNAILVRVDEKLKDRIQKACEMEDRSMSSYLRYLVIKDLEKKKL